MRLDNFSYPVFDEKDLFEAIYHEYNFDPSKTIFIENYTENITKFEKNLGYEIFHPKLDLKLEQNQVDSALQAQWKMPEEYYELDIEKWVLDQCSNSIEFKRAREELDEFKSRNMLNLLSWLKYFVDICTEKDILWGIGRGSSVASFVLYKIGVHSIDPLKYNLDWRDFLR